MHVRVLFIFVVKIMIFWAANELHIGSKPVVRGKTFVLTPRCHCFAYTFRASLGSYLLCYGKHVKAYHIFQAVFNVVYAFFGKILVFGVN